MKVTTVIALVLILISCNDKTYHIETVSNPVYRQNTAFISYEDISLPRFDSLKIKYQLDTIFHGETDEFKRILLLRNWIRQKISVNDFGDPYPGNDHPSAIIDEASRGQGFHCGHYMVVQNAVMNAFGYITRCLGSGPGVKSEADGHHGMNEIWLNKYHKWFLSDAKFNHHFEKDGVPLSALEIRDEFLKNKAADIVLVKGPDRMPIQYDSLRDKTGIFRQKNKEWFAQWYTWLEWDEAANRFSAWPTFNTRLNMYKDDYSSKNTWYWDGKPHWAYNTKEVTYHDTREAIEWTPNTINADASVKGDHATVKLTSFTPNFKEYQIRQEKNGEWIKCDSLIDIRLKKDREEYSFRTVNSADVAGPEYTLVFVAN